MYNLLCNVRKANRPTGDYSWVCAVLVPLYIGRNQIWSAHNMKNCMRTSSVLPSSF